MDKKIKEQILVIRDSGETNMFDVRKVQEIALREGYDELLDYLADNTGAYTCRYHCSWKDRHSIDVIYTDGDAVPAQPQRKDDP